jgi:hypothetical protein
LDTTYEIQRIRIRINNNTDAINCIFVAILIILLYLLYDLLYENSVEKVTKIIYFHYVLFHI